MEYVNARVVHALDMEQIWIKLKKYTNSPMSISMRKATKK